MVSITEILIHRNLIFETEHHSPHSLVLFLLCCCFKFCLLTLAFDGFVFCENDACRIGNNYESILSTSEFRVV